MGEETSHTEREALRADARQNRDRALQAARELFATSGLDVTMRQVARRAGIGPATLYRRFPTKQALLAATFKDEMDACSTIIDEAAADPDHWRGFRHALESLVVLGAQNRGFTDAFMRTHPEALDLATHRAELLAVVATISQRAKAAGRLRADFELSDFVLVLRAARGLATGSPDERANAAAAWPRS